METELRYGSENDCGFCQKNCRHPDALSFVHGLAAPHFDQILDADVRQDECPGNMVLRMIALPVRTGSFADEVHEEHINEQKNMLADAVPPEYIDIVSRKIPDLDNSQRTERIGIKGCRLNKSVRKAVQQQIIPAYNINENQVIDQLNIFDFFLFLSRQIHRHTSPH